MATVKDSVRKKVIVTRRLGDGEDKAKIFSSAVISKNGRKTVEQFRVPVDIEVELPVEIITQLKQRGLPVEKNGNLTIVKEFLVEVV